MTTTSSPPAPSAPVDPIQRLTRDLKQASATLSKREARFLVDTYYLLQEHRKRASNQLRALDEADEPTALVYWLAENTATLERNIKTALKVYADHDPVGQWSQSIVGIGPVIAAGLLAHIDLAPNGQRINTVGHIWSFAGLNPTATWEKGQKRPWNAQLKTLCWKIGESFVKVSAHKADVYGHLYVIRKQREIERNDRGEYADQAAHKLATVKIGKTTEAYKAYSAGRLPPAHLHARAKRWVVKLFLSHWFHVAYTLKWGGPPPKPYVITHLGHADEIHPPNFP